MNKTANERFRDIRLSMKRKTSQERFAEILEVSLSTVQKIEQGAKITDEVIEALESKLNVNPNYITSGKGDKFKGGFIPEIKEPSETTIDPWRDALVSQLKADADIWRQKYEQVFSRLEFLMDRLPLGKHKPVRETALPTGTFGF